MTVSPREWLLFSTPSPDKSASPVAQGCWEDGRITGPFRVPRECCGGYAYSDRTRRSRWSSGVRLRVGILPGGGKYLLYGILDDFAAFGLRYPRLEKRFQTLQGFFFRKGFLCRKVWQGPLKDVVLEGLAMQCSDGPE